MSVLDRRSYPGINDTAFKTLELLAEKGARNGVFIPFGGSESSNVGVNRVNLSRILSSLEKCGYISIKQEGRLRSVALNLPNSLEMCIAENKPTCITGADMYPDTGPDRMSAPTPEQMACECALELPPFYKKIKNIKELYIYGKHLTTLFDGSDVVDLSGMVKAAGLSKLVPFGRPDLFGSWQLDFSDFHKAMYPSMQQMDWMEEHCGFDAYHFFTLKYRRVLIDFFVMSMAVELACFPDEMFFNPGKWDADGSNFKEQWESSITGPIATCIRACSPEGEPNMLGGRILYTFDMTRHEHILDHAVEVVRDYVVKLLSREDTAQKCYFAFIREFYDWAINQSWVYSGLNRIRAQDNWLEGAWGPDLSQGLLCREHDGYLPRLSYTMVLLRNLAGITAIARLLQTGGDEYSYGICIAALTRLYSPAANGELNSLRTLATAFAPYFPFFNRLVDLNKALYEHIPADLRKTLNLA